MNTTNEDIVQHVMSNTTIINDEAFKVEKLSNYKSDYVSFKISTLKKELYMMIKHIWEPHYTARDFIENSMSRTPTKRTPSYKAKKKKHGTNSI